MKRRAFWVSAAAAKTAVLLLCVSFRADADDPPARAAAPLTSTEAKAEPEAAKEEAFTPPPGFRTRKRGDKVVYCRKETPLGSRFAAEKCYDEVRLRELMRRLELEQIETVEKIRSCTGSYCS